MNGETKPVDLTAIDRRLRALNSELDEAVAKAKGRKNLMLGVMVFMVVAMIIYLSVAHNEIKQFDARDVVNLAEKQARDFLDRPPKEISAELTKMAPDIIKKGEVALLAAPADFSAQFQVFVKDKVTSEIPNLEESLYKNVKVGLDEAKSQIKGGDKTPVTAAELDNALKVVAGRFGNEVQKFIDQVYVQYKPLATQYSDYFRVLGDGQALDARQAYHRKLILNFLTLYDKWETQPPPTDQNLKAVETLIKTE